MLKISNETKVGILAAFAIVIVILGINFLKGKNVFSRNVTLYAYYANVQGLSASNPVLIRGLEVGQVDGMELKEDHGDSILVKFHIEGKIEIPENSIATIVSPDLLGSKALQIEAGNSHLMAHRNDTLKGKVQMSITDNLNQTLAPVKDKVEKLLSSVDTVVNTLNDVFDENTKRNLRSSFHSIKTSLDNITLTTNKVNDLVGTEAVRIRDIMMHINHLVNTLDKNSPQITAAINNISAITDSIRAANLQKTITELNGTVAKINTMLTKTNNGEGSLGKLLNDDKLYNNLLSSSADLDKLIIDLKENPSKYVNFSIIKIGGGKKKK